MTATPTPDPHDLHGYLEKVEQPLLLLADCHGKIESQVMERWLEGQARGAGIDLQTQRVTFDLSGNAGAPALLEHRTRDLPDDTLVIPLRVLWLPAKDHGHRLRDLLLGNPHNPGWLKQKLILHFTPDRCSPVYGEAATLGCSGALRALHRPAGSRVSPGPGENRRQIRQGTARPGGRGPHLHQGTGAHLHAHGPGPADSPEPLCVHPRLRPGYRG